MASATTQSIRGDTRTVILETAIRLFAELGFAGVATRMIAREVGIGIATLYHHFPDKDSLYVATLRHAFASQEKEFVEILNSSGPAIKRLERMIHRFTHMVVAEPHFIRLVKREQLEADPKRMRMIVESAIGDAVEALYRLCAELRTPHEPFMLMMSIFGMILHHYEAAAMWPLYPHFKQQFLQPDVAASHVFELLSRGLLAGAASPPTAVGRRRGREVAAAASRAARRRS